MAQLQGNSETDIAAIKADNTGNGAGVWSNAQSGTAILGQSVEGKGIMGESTKASGVMGISHAPFNAGVTGVNDNMENTAGPGVFGTSNATGIWGKSKTWIGVFGETESVTGAAGVWGKSVTGGGVLGESIKAVGVFGKSEEFEGVHAETHSKVTAAIAAYNLNSDGTGAAIFAKKVGVNGNAGHFEGNVFINGNLSATGDIFLTNADFAEDFDILDNMGEPGTVMVLSKEGGLKQSSEAYDKKVAGVISGAGNYKPGIILDRHQEKNERKPLAMVGKVYCKVDANYAPIEVGDLLTSSDTSGHAMKATDNLKAFGTIIGKALGNLNSGTGLIPILVSLQ